MKLEKVESQKSLEINTNFGELQSLQTTKTVKLDPTKIEENILLSPFDFVNYLECKIPEKEAKEQKFLFPLKIYESEKKTKFTISELNPQNDLVSQIYKEDKNFIFSMALDDKIIFSDNSGNIKFYSLKEKKIIKVLQYPLKNTPEKYKSYAMDITPDDIFSLVGYQNGDIAVFEKTKCKQVIKTGNACNIINIKVTHQMKKQIQFLYSDMKGNVNLVTLNGKTFGGFEEQVESIVQSSEKAPFYLIYKLQFKDTELAANKSLKDLNDTFVFVNSENTLLYTYNNNFNKLHTFPKPKYLQDKKDNSLPDVVLGLGKQPSNNESTEGDADLLLLYLISWEKVIYLNVLPIMNKIIEIVVPSGYYINEAPIVRIGFLNLSTIYLIDKQGNFKILNSRRFNQGFINIDAKQKCPIVPEENKHAEMQNVFKMDMIKSHSYLSNKNYELYIYSIINNRKKNELFAFGQNTIYQQSLKNYQVYMDTLCKNGEWNDLLLLGQNIYKGKMFALNGIPMKIDERKKKVKEYLQGLLQKYIDWLLNSNKLENNIDIIIEFCLEVDLGNYLFEKIMKSNNLKNYKDQFLLQLEPFILCDKVMEVDVPKNIIFDLIQFYQNNNQMEKLEHLLIHFNMKTLNNNEIKKKLQELSIISPLIFISINEKPKDYFKPVTLIYDKYTKANKLESFTDYKDLVKNKKMDLDKIKSTKQYIGHKLLWYLQKTLDGKKFPSFIESIDPVLYFSAVTKISYWLLTEKVFNDLIMLETGTFFNIIIFIFSNEDIIETFEENNEDPEKKAEALKILKQGGNMSYKSENVDLSDLISYIISLGDKLLNSEEIQKKEKEKINLYLKIFEITVGKRMKLNVKDKKEAIKFVIQNNSKYKIKLDLSKKIVEILEGKDFEMKDYDEILYIMTKGSFDDIRLFILKKKKLYMDCLNLLLDSEVKINKLNEMIFTFINMTLTRLQIKKLMKEYKTFKADVKKNLIKISEKSLENCYTIINFWFSKDKKGCLDQLKENSEMQLKYIEYSVKKIIEAKENKDIEFIEDEEYMKYLLQRHVYLLCNMNKKNEIITWLKKLNDYPIKECIEICKKSKVYDALIYLYKKEGNIIEALRVCYEIINNTFNEILVNLKSKEFNEDLNILKKDEFIKFIDDSIETIELEEKENEKNNSNEHESWKEFIKKLYKIQDDFSKESKNPKDRKEIYSDIAELILSQIQRLIIRMAPYVGEQNVFDFVLKVNPKAKVIEFKPFFFETLKGFGLEKNILNFLLDSINEFSLEEKDKLEEINTKGEYFELYNYSCNVCNNFFNTGNLTEKLIRFRCQHMQHRNCGSNVCLKCLNDNYKKWSCRKPKNKSEEADEKEFVEFLNSYETIKTEMELSKSQKKQGERKKASNTKDFSKNFRKLMALDNYNNKNRRNFVIEGVKYSMNE